MPCQASEMRRGEAEKRKIGKKKDCGKRRRGRGMKRCVRNKDVKRSGEMSGGGGCSLGSVPAAFTCSTTTTITTHPSTEASLEVSRL